MEIGWEYASYIASYILNVNVTKPSHRRTPEQLNPMIPEKKKPTRESTDEEIKRFALQFRK